MRTIKFRGKIIDNGEWIIGDLIQATNGIIHILPIESYRWKDNEIVDPQTIGQFTGLFDKNGKEIFEGDIIEEGNVYFDDLYLGFFVKGDFVEGEHKPLYDIHLPEIIGNIFDNPELLKN